MKNLSKKTVSIILSLITAIAIVIICYFIFLNKNIIQGTIKSDEITLTSKIQGQVTQILFDNNSEVKKGEILAQINPEQYQKDYDTANEKLKKAQQELKISKKDIEKINALIIHTKQDIKSAKQMLESANDDYVIYKNAYKDGSVTQKDLDNAIKNLDVARNYYKTAQNNLETVSEALNTTVSKKTSQDKQIEKLMAEVENAQLNLSYATIVSPINGIIKDKKIELSKEIKKDDIIATINSKDYYILANVKSSNIQKGQLVTIILKGKNIKGIVDEINGKAVKINFLEDISGLNLNSKQKVKIKLP